MAIARINEMRKETHVDILPEPVKNKIGLTEIREVEHIAEHREEWKKICNQKEESVKQWILNVKYNSQANPSDFLNTEEIDNAYTLGMRSLNNKKYAE